MSSPGGDGGLCGNGMAGPTKQYDDDELVMDIARAELTQAEIGEKHGLAEVTISAIARGERRAELQPRIKAAVQGMIEQARRLGSRLAGAAMERLGKMVAEDSKAADGVQHKAAVDILRFALGDPSRPQVNVNQQQTATPGLTGERLKKLAEIEGGPKV